MSLYKTQFASLHILQWDGKGLSGHDVEGVQFLCSSHFTINLWAKMNVFLTKFLVASSFFLNNVIINQYFSELITFTVCSCLPNDDDKPGVIF